MPTPKVMLGLNQAIVDALGLPKPGARPDSMPTSQGVMSLSSRCSAGGIELSQTPLHRALRIQQVVDVTGLGRSTIYLMVSEGRFPKQRRLGVRAVGWLAEDVFRWLAERDAP